MQTVLNGGDGVTFLNQGGILYTTPVFEGGEVRGVIAGERNKENMQKLIRLESFSGKGLTCIVDSNGDVVISPTNLDPFLHLEDVFMDEGEDSRQTVQDIRRMQEDMKAKKSGSFAFTAVDKSELTLAYNPLDSYDWVLLTLIPSDLISQQTDLYISQSFFIINGMIFLFALILFVLFRTYREHFGQMKRLAFVDRLTGAMNNTAFQIRCRELLEGAPPGSYTVVLLNIKNFKLINEEFDTAAGDTALRRVMEVLCRRIRPEEIAARADSDNFFLCLKESDPETTRRRLGEMVDEINDTRELAHPLTIQQGAYLIEDPTLDITIVQDRAKTACRDERSTLREGQCVFYDMAVTQQLKKEWELNELFESSLKKGDFQLYLQPKVSLGSRQVAGAEALVRWIHPEKGMIYPSDFIPLFEKNGKICQLDLYIFEEACKTIRKWIDNGEPVLTISVNLSRRHFQGEDCLNAFYAIARQYRIPRDLLEMELTESIFFDDSTIEIVKGQIHRMHEMGFRCSLDDFGSGYSSLGMMMEFDVDVIKMDRRFFLDIDAPKARKLIVSIVRLAKEIGAQTVAEGIEAEDQVSFLAGIGCDMIQGYVFSKPRPVSEFEQWAREFSAAQ
ncbi:EAL domain-containing protein [Oscillibacter sp. MSJ-2]|uniref:EAL domain-containing protein n=2 Tax=Dysosmobacter acutus TaxID=2841504 RepID=A0ABS6F972_9FIRM|nr:EAL domain-containing protein [Dysosmobacter acutus]